MIHLTRITMTDIAANLKIIQAKISNACVKRSSEFGNISPRLVAVSKLNPPDLIIEAYNNGQRHFGENYVNELVDKANHPDIKTKDIRWHFIGHLQRNKVNKVLACPNLYMVETIETEKLASALDSAWQRYKKQDDSQLKVMVQVNTSGEAEKNGCEPSQATALVKYVMNNCNNLKFMGLMTIGAYGYDPVNGPNPDFIALIKCRENICNDLELSKNNVELSMGMSTDYEHAIELGSTSVRVGTALFGERPPKD